MIFAFRCNGSKRYAIRCRRYTKHPSGLCHQHRGQTHNDIRSDDHFAVG